MIFAFFLCGLVVLFLWLSGHWFGRVLAFLALFVVCSLVAIQIAAEQTPGVVLYTHQFVECFGVAGIVAWVLASLPALYFQHLKKKQALLPTLYQSIRPDSASGQS